MIYFNPYFHQLLTIYWRLPLVSNIILVIVYFNRQNILRSASVPLVPLSGWMNVNRVLFALCKLSLYNINTSLLPCSCTAKNSTFSSFGFLIFKAILKLIRLSSGWQFKKNKIRGVVGIWACFYKRLGIIKELPFRCFCNIFARNKLKFSWINSGGLHLISPYNVTAK